jgi:hypothetical protein
MATPKKTWISHTPDKKEFESEQDAERYERLYPAAERVRAFSCYPFVTVLAVLTAVDKAGLLNVQRAHKRREFSEPWIQWDNARALQEGWDLMDLEGRWTIQKIDDPSSVEGLDYTEPKFASDTRAVMHVAEQAMFGSQYHFIALDLMTTLVE